MDDGIGIAEPLAEGLAGLDPADQRLVDRVVHDHAVGVDGAAARLLADAERVNEHLRREFQSTAGVEFAQTYLAPEAPDQPSRGRKPSPQFLFDARDEFGLNLADCFMVGDKLIDLECGWNAGVKKSFLVRTGYGAKLEQQEPEKLARAIVVNDLRGVAEWICNATNSITT